MDPRERADATLARARARGAFVVTPESAVSPMDATSTLQIPRAVVTAIDERANDPEATLVVPAATAHGMPPRQDNVPAIAQEALTDMVSSPRAAPIPAAAHGGRPGSPGGGPAQQAEAAAPLTAPLPAPAQPTTQVAMRPVAMQPVAPPPPPFEPEELDGLVPTVKQPPSTQSSLSQRLAARSCPRASLRVSNFSRSASPARTASRTGAQRQPWCRSAM